jgi:hypothetical protein
VATKRKAGGRPFTKGDPRINRKGVSKEKAQYNELVRERLAQLLAKPSRFNMPGVLTPSLDIILQTAIDRAEAGDALARRDVLEWFAGKPPIEVQAAPGTGMIIWDIPASPHIAMAVGREVAKEKKR